MSITHCGTYQQKSFNRGDEIQFNNNFNIEYRPIPALRLTGRFGFTTSRGKLERSAHLMTHHLQM